MGCLRLDILEQSFVPMKIVYKKHDEEYIRLDSHLGIDPLADGGGQQVLSPYHAMGCNPAMMVDPLGLQQTGMSSPGMRHFDIYEEMRARFPTLYMHLPGGKLFGAITDYFKMSSNIPSFVRAEASISILSGGAGGRGFEGSFQNYLIGKNISALNAYRSLDDNPNEKTRDYVPVLFRDGIYYPPLEGVLITDKGPNWTDWGARMHARFGSSLGWNFEGYGVYQDGRMNIWQAVFAETRTREEIEFSKGQTMARAAKAGYLPFRADAAGFSINYNLIGIDGGAGSVNFGFVGNNFGIWTTNGVAVGTPDISIGVSFFNAEYRGVGVPTIESFMGMGISGGLGIGIFSIGYGQGLDINRPVWHSYSGGVGIGGRTFTIISGQYQPYNYSSLIKKW